MSAAVESEIQFCHSSADYNMLLRSYHSSKACHEWGYTEQQHVVCAAIAPHDDIKSFSWKNRPTRDAFRRPGLDGEERET